MKSEVVVDRASQMWRKVRSTLPLVRACSADAVVARWYEVKVKAVLFGGLLVLASLLQQARLSSRIARYQREHAWDGMLPATKA